MRFSACLLLLLSLGSLSLSAETIVLKNGRKILVDSVREEKDKVLYEIGDSSYAIPKSSVDHIDAFGSPLSSHGPAAAPEFVPQTATPVFGAAAEVHVIKNDRIDDVAIADAERNGDAATAAAANFMAGRFALEQGDRDAAARYFDRALRFKSDDANVLINYAAVLVRTGRPQEALPLAERAVRAAPDSPDAWAVLGYANLQADRSKDAIPAFEKSLKLRPDPTVEAFLKRAHKETTTEADYTAAESSHFTLRFEGKASQNGLPRDILEQLDSDYDGLVSQLGVAPHGSITVILYTEQAFFDVTQAPSWSGAINDGKLRIPISGVSQMTSELARVLRHELTHSFITQIARGRCPYWLNEGVAQLMEPKSISSAGPLLAKLYASQREIPLNALEGSFMGLDGNSAAIAYAESLTAVEYINDTYGMSDVRRLLERIGEGSSTEAALRSTFNVGYGQFEEDIATYLKSKYGQ
ncbi:TPR repeat protein [Candidatus Koribacter versatilis Ellin345]|uniref:TPR repeat protein n=1 Tax=Koribacter versatilis (strain Ellin345) TaxID=204669 RepID=Q1IIM3_KORVE|nr:tetratricopeptide repeat protein [Candidatus Koribacter versatilis]ABF43277.1 TPR repeat protein [Candidatus Koribacter versatilis Ellin345]